MDSSTIHRQRSGTSEQLAKRTGAGPIAKNPAAAITAAIDWACLDSATQSYSLVLPSVTLLVSRPDEDAPFWVSLNGQRLPCIKATTLEDAQIAALHAARAVVQALRDGAAR